MHKMKKIFKKATSLEKTKKESEKKSHSIKEKRSHASDEFMGEFKKDLGFPKHRSDKKKEKANAYIMKNYPDMMEYHKKMKYEKKHETEKKAHKIAAKKIRVQK